MSQHQIEVQSPRVGRVFVTVGYDPILNEAFLSYYNNDVSYMSPSGLSVGEIPQLAKDELGAELPQQVIDGVQGDLADLRLGATDVGRRISRYESDGALAESVKA